MYVIYKPLIKFKVLSLSLLYISGLVMISQFSIELTFLGTQLDDHFYNIVSYLAKETMLRVNVRSLLYTQWFDQDGVKVKLANII